MAYETYPKSKAHPSGGVGEARSVSSWAEHTATEYKTPTVQDTVFNGHKCKTLHCEGGSGGKNKSDYPKKSRSFGTEGFR